MVLPGAGAGDGDGDEMLVMSDDDVDMELSSEDEKEKAYHVLTPPDRILMYPDLYIGSLGEQVEKRWTYNEGSGSIGLQPVSFSPGLYRIFDEILVNSSDNKDKGMTRLEVEIDEQTGSIMIFNDGQGIPVEEKLMGEKKGFLPELLFSHVGTRGMGGGKTGGINGYGAKFTNLYSTEFEVRTSDGIKLYTQKFLKNMSTIGKPTIEDCTSSQPYTRVTFVPDLHKFGMSCLEGDVLSLFQKRVVDMAFTLGNGVNVLFNNKLIPSKSFAEYVEHYIGSDLEKPRIYDKTEACWDVCLTLSQGNFKHVSFINGLETFRGGSHLDFIVDQITSKLINYFNENHKGVKIDQTKVKTHLWLFINAQIENPRFDSHSKEALKNPKEEYDSTYNLSDDFMEKVLKLGIIRRLLNHDSDEESSISRIPKLEDAREAGGKNSGICTLILTEGDSAKTIAMAGLVIVGRKHYGVYPLIGKILNVKYATTAQIDGNVEIRRIMRIMGLKADEQYTSTQSLRYGHLMIMADADHDGSHLTGLVINLFHKRWPSLLKIDGFLQQFITPIIKVTRGITPPLLFFSMPDYKAWKEREGSTSSWSIKYYKGVGTNTPAEGKAYFRDLKKHVRTFLWLDEEDGNSIDIAFSPNRIKDRKDWMDLKTDCINHEDNRIPYRDFINKELRLYSLAHLKRLIPSIMDGLKPVHRKILFCCFKRDSTKEIKVAQLAGYVAEHSGYQHGEKNLHGTIISMAQNFTGSNNINLLHPSGQFGTRRMAGKDAANSHYIYTFLSPIAPVIFPKEDEDLLTFLNDDGIRIEPICYFPILPMVLVNGTKGIGTGWQTSVLNYKPQDIVDRLESLIRPDKILRAPMLPWYRGFKGKFTRAPEGHYCYGVIKKINDTTLWITEIPIHDRLDDYKVKLQSMLRSNNVKEDSKGKRKRNQEIVIEEIQIEGDEVNIDILVILTPENMVAAVEKGLLKVFGLISKIESNNMYIFDGDGTLTKFTSPEEIIFGFFRSRLPIYEKRTVTIKENFQKEIKKKDNKIKFIHCVLQGKITFDCDDTDLMAQIRKNGIEPLAEEGHDSGYEYLLSMQVRELSRTNLSVLELQKKELEAGYKFMTAKELWLLDLEKFKNQLTIHEKSYEDAKPKGRELREVMLCIKNGVNKASTPSMDAHDEDEDHEVDPLAATCVSKKGTGSKTKSSNKPTGTEGGSSAGTRRSSRNTDPVNYLEYSDVSDLE